MKSLGPIHQTAGFLARSPILRRGRALWEKNSAQWNMPLSKPDKLWIGAYLILRDYASGEFPPKFEDQQQAYQNEINYRQSIPGMTAEEVGRNELTKPFWFGQSLERYFQGFLQITRAFQTAGITPPARLLEIGGGSGWAAEFLTRLGFKVVCTTISPHDVETGQSRRKGLEAAGVSSDIQFLAAPMESVADHVKDLCPFDAVYVFEALHHAFDWRATVGSSFKCLRPGGWLLIANEPNVLHTAVSYRVAKLSNTHEIGFSKKQLVNHLRKVGFRRVLSLGRKPHLLFRPHWLLAQK